MSTKTNFAIEAEPEDDTEFGDAWLEPVTNKGAAGRPAGGKKQADYAARKAIEDYLERKRMRELLEDDLFADPLE